MSNNLPVYRESTLLYKVSKFRLAKAKLGKEEEICTDVGVVKINGRMACVVEDLLSGKISSRIRYEVRPLWIGWFNTGIWTDDGWMIKKYGLLKDDLSDV